VLAVRPQSGHCELRAAFVTDDHLFGSEGGRTCKGRRRLEMHCPTEPTSKPHYRVANQVHPVATLLSVASCGPWTSFSPTHQHRFGMPRAVWYDPGVKRCPRPSGLDAGLCILSPKAGGVRCLPSFVIIGVQKAATRELYSWLRLHTVLGKEGNTPGLPELRYLDKIGSFNAAESRTRWIGPARKKIEVVPELGFWRNYVRFFPSWKVTQPRSHGRLPGPAIAGSIYSYEKTPSYVVMSSSAIRQLRQLFPSMRWILSLRNPTDRLYSWFHMKCADTDAKHGRGYIAEVIEGPLNGTIIYNTEAVGVELAKASAGLNPSTRHALCTPDTFDRLLFGSADKSARATPSVTIDNGVSAPLARGYYGQALRRWLEHFPPHQIHVLTVDALFSSPLSQLRRIEHFLGIDPFEWESHFRKVGNTTTIKESTSKVEMHARPDPMSLRARAFLNAHYAPHVGDLRRALSVYPDVEIPPSWPS
jgi:hypothetical protein